MRPTIDPEAPRLCNSCVLKNDPTKTKGNIMETIGITVQFPKEIQIDIEEFCINKGIDFTQYFLNLHHNQFGSAKEEEQVSDEVIKKTYGGRKK